jgi:hypothetical protein
MCLKWHILHVLLFFVSRAVHTSAQCNEGFVGANSGVCSACPVNTYKSGNGTGIYTCQDNPNWRSFSSTYNTCYKAFVFPRQYSCNTYDASWQSCSNCCVSCSSQCAVVGGIITYSCSSCPVGTYGATTGATSLDACECPAGFTRPSGGPCTVCPAGKYKIAIGSAVCTDCGAGTYSTTVGATVATTCLACNAGFTVYNNVCVCDLGYEPGV